jgi:hypothetical protein
LLKSFKKASKSVNFFTLKDADPIDSKLDFKTIFFSEAKLFKSGKFLKFIITVPSIKNN